MCSQYTLSKHVCFARAILRSFYKKQTPLSTNVKANALFRQVVRFHDHDMTYGPLLPPN